MKTNRATLDLNARKETTLHLASLQPTYTYGKVGYMKVPDKQQTTLEIE
jgi:hypothetical protein